MRLLIVEDNIIIAKAMERCLEKAFVIDAVTDGKAGMHAASTTEYDAIILDLNLPDITGTSVCRHIRKSKNDSPILIVSGECEIASKVTLLNSGADDYIEKPFNFTELRARIDAVIRRRSSNIYASDIVSAGLVLSPGSRAVTRFGRSIQLSRKEFDLLEYMMRNEG